jgi:hypothetical protein
VLPPLRLTGRTPDATLRGSLGGPVSPLGNSGTPSNSLVVPASPLLGERLVSVGHL